MYISAFVAKPHDQGPFHVFVNGTPLLRVLCIRPGVVLKGFREKDRKSRVRKLHMPARAGTVLPVDEQLGSEDAPFRLRLC